MRNKIIFLFALLFFGFLSLTYASAVYTNGIDVSNYQHACLQWSGSTCVKRNCIDINWGQVYSSGYKFAFIKSTQGDDRAPQIVNPCFRNDMNAGKAAGVLVGAYHFACTINNATREANFFVQNSSGYFGPGYLRPVLDLETQTSCTLACNTSSCWNSYSSWVDEWMSAVEKSTGVKPILYVTCEYARNLNSVTLQKYPLWIANTGVSSPCSGQFAWNFWQYSWTGSVSGISGNVDLDYFNGDMTALNSFVISSSDQYPHVNSFDPVSYSVSVGNPVVFNFNVSDDIGLYKVALWRADDVYGSPYGWNETKVIYVSGKNYVGTISDSPVFAGNYWYGLHVNDNSGDISHWNDEKNSQTGFSPGIYGPDRISLTGCTDECTPGQTRCFGNVSQICGNYDGDSCYEWGNDSVCTYGCGSASMAAAPSVGGISPMASSSSGCNSCVPQTCSQMGRQCDSWDNGCGQIISCGSCGTGQTCNSNGQCVVNNGGSTDTGWKFPTKTGVIYNEWYNPGNAYASDNVYAWRDSSKGFSLYAAMQDYYNFGFFVPTGAVINGIEIRVEGYCTSSSTNNVRIHFINHGGDEKTIQFGTSESIKTYGSSSDLWNTGWLASDFSNSSFGIYLLAYASDQSAKNYIDSISAKIYYTPAACAQDIDCGHGGLVGNLFCSNGNVVQNKITYTCNNPGTVSSSCSSSLNPQLITTCNDGCSSGDCLDPSTGWKSPSVTGTSLNSWTNPTNAFSSDDAYATVKGTYLEQDYSNFNFNIPSGAIPQGIQVRAEGQPNVAADGYFSDSRVLIYAWSSSFGSWDRENGANFWSFGNYYDSGYDITMTRPSVTSDLWSNRWTVDDFSNSKFKLKMTTWSNPYLTKIDQIQARVYYDWPTCSSNSECGVSAPTGGVFCSGSNVLQNYINYTCNNPGTLSSYCSSSTSSSLIKTCSAGQVCSSGNCFDVACSSNSQCGTNGFTGDASCYSDGLYKNYVSYICNNPGTVSSSCSSSSSLQLYQSCSTNWSVQRAADFNNDCTITLEDFGILKDHFGKCSALYPGCYDVVLPNDSWSSGDANRDGNIDLQDFGVLKDNFGKSCTDGSPLVAAAPVVNTNTPATSAPATTKKTETKVATVPNKATAKTNAKTTLVVPAVIPAKVVPVSNKKVIKLN